jgi:hypothetical protein
MRRIFLTFALLSAACGGPPGPLTVEVAGGPTPLEKLPAYLTAPGLEEHVREAAVNMAEGWGGDPSMLDGYVLAFEQLPFDCGRTGAGADRVAGCTWEAAKLIQLLAWGSGCVEATLLAHEVGHVVIGDNGHTDSRWRDPEFWDRMKRIAERTAPEGCDLSRLADHNEKHDD